jgi:photosynthetic reaction center cytochrome c subunit
MSVRDSRIGWLAAATAVVVILSAGSLSAQTPAPEPTKPGIAESPTITVLKGLMVPQFEVEMRHFVQALGVNCGGCHVPRNFPSEDHPRKAVARRMIEMTRALNAKYFPDYTPPEGETSLGRVTCYTCHQGSTTPAKGPAAPAPR